MAAPLNARDPRRHLLVPFLRVMRRSEAELRRLLEKTAIAAASDINRLAGNNIGAIVRRGQLREAQRELLRTLSLFWIDSGDTIKAARLEAAMAALGANFDWEKPLFDAAGISRQQQQVMRDGAVAVSQRNVDLMIRRFTTQQIPLSQQVYRTQALTRGWVDGLINRAIGRGLSARELAGEVRQFINPKTPGGASYAAMRLARTELNNAYHVASIAANIEKPWVEGMKWTLSGSHPKADVCDTLAQEDNNDLGAGVFPKGDVPPKPHPQCFCYLVPIESDEDAFVMAFQRGAYDKYLDKIAS